MKKYVINPVEAREAAQDKPVTLAMRCALPTGMWKPRPASATWKIPR